MEDTFAACIALGQRYGFEEEHSRQDARLVRGGVGGGFSSLQ